MRNTMKTDTLGGRDFLTTADCTREQIEAIIDVAPDLKRNSPLRECHGLLEDMTLFTIFYRLSLRTRNSFEARMTRLEATPITCVPVRSTPELLTTRCVSTEPRALVTWPL
ncbi:MAG: hypothetical protein GTO63_00685 [Anaerolineae bacterium]|nr:hypothetical protein [Anaerolineae bacterium]NIN93522.1 hypothetical protein [Anaerolineae bacterium]NIQ76596.1 hypothetical protein [Anaerolineae bacterium]